jgi:DNA-directed RNA polymerase subunit RPC12/RpoP
MIKVLREGTRNRIECDYCGALLAYDKEDIKKDEVHWGLHYHTTTYFLHCPQCKNKIILEATR